MKDPDACHIILRLLENDPDAEQLIRDTAKVKEVLPALDDRTSALTAHDFAYILLRRNEAAHTRPSHEFEHASETEEFLVSAGPHLPATWSLTANQT